MRAHARGSVALRRHHTARPLAAEARRVCRTGAAVAEQVWPCHMWMSSLLPPDTEGEASPSDTAAKLANTACRLRARPCTQVSTSQAGDSSNNAASEPPGKAKGKAKGKGKGKGGKGGGGEAARGASTVSSGVKLEDVCITFKNQQLLRGVSWEVKRGERVGLVGAPRPKLVP